MNDKSGGSRARVKVVEDEGESEGDTFLSFFQLKDKIHMKK